jgi:hypothetical protein
VKPRIWGRRFPSGYSGGFDSRLPVIQDGVMPSRI